MHRIHPLLVLAPIALLGTALATSAIAEQPTKRPTDEVRGKELYDRHCEACHGAWNKGHGPATQALVRPVPNLVGKVTSDDKVIQIVLRGKGAMPGYEQTFDRFDAKRVLDHMAKLKQPDGPAGEDPAPPADAPEAPEAPAATEPDAAAPPPQE